MIRTIFGFVSKKQINDICDYEIEHLTFPGTMSIESTVDLSSTIEEIILWRIKNLGGNHLVSKQEILWNLEYTYLFYKDRLLYTPLYCSSYKEIQRLEEYCQYLCDFLKRFSKQYFGKELED